MAKISLIWSNKLAVCLAAMLGFSPDSMAGELRECAYKGFHLYGRVQVVESFPDLKVQIVESFPDLNVQAVTSFPDKCGRWQFVESFPDFKIQFVTSFPDLKIRYVTSFPGVP